MLCWNFHTETRWLKVWEVLANTWLGVLSQTWQGYWWGICPLYDITKSSTQTELWMLFSSFLLCCRPHWTTAVLIHDSSVLGIRASASELVRGGMAFFISVCAWDYTYWRRLSCKCKGSSLGWGLCTVCLLWGIKWAEHRHTVSIYMH